MGLCVAPFATHLSTKYFHTSRNAKEVSEVEIAISRELSCELNKISHMALVGSSREISISTSDTASDFREVESEACR